MPLSNQQLTDRIDQNIPNSGTYGVFALLNDVFTSAVFTAAAATDAFTFAAPHKLVTGSRFQISASVKTPQNLLASTTYYAIVTSTTELKPALTLALANSSTAINFTDDGAGTLTLIEQSLTVEDPIAVLINHELNATDDPNYVRVTYANPGGAVNGVKPTFEFNQAVSASNPTLDFRSVFLIKGGTTTIGNTTGTKDYLTAAPARVLITAGSSKIIRFTVSLENKI